MYEHLKPLAIISYPAAEKTSTSDVKGKQNLSTHRLKPVVYLSKEWSKWLAEPKSQSTGRILKVCVGGCLLSCPSAASLSAW